MSLPDEWSRTPAFPSGAAGLVSTIDDYLAFSRFLLNRGVHRGRRLLSAGSARLLTTNHLMPDQLTGAGPFPLQGREWGYGMAVTVAPDEISAPGRYGWEGGYGIFNGGTREFPVAGRSGSRAGG